MAKITETTVEKTVNSNEIDAKSILDRLEKLEKENAELKEGKENMFKKAREKYSGPLKYSYKLWGEDAVLSIKSVKRDSTKDWQYKKGDEFISNHDLELTLANGKKVKVDVIDFGNNHTRSEKKFAKDEEGRDITTKSLKVELPKLYVMEDDKRGTIEVQPNAIN